ncbi:hypothetical protein [Streptomyces sp. NPDC048411]|uniref:hypothetical protein n=1 Tax=Streptomyces sp. NPDC048411 TaxID=3157206 RepID=UPI0034519408
MTSKNRHLIAAATLALGLGISAVAAPSVNAAEPTGLRANSTRTFASYQDAVPGVAPSDADATAVYLDPSGQVIPRTDATDATTEAALACTPVSGRDNPHRSSTGVAVSGHGWWDKGSCSNNRANVYNCLYEWYADNTWRQKTCSPVKELAPGGGSSNRTTARRDCDNTVYTSWRNHVDVDVIGEADTAEWPYNQANVYCRIN